MDIPDSSTFYCALDTTLTRKHVAGLYGAVGWRIRKSSWMDFEVMTDWAELIIESEQPIFIHGPVADLPARIDELVGPLRAAGIPFTAECYSPERELL